MQTKFRIVETPEYILAVSEKVKVDSIIEWYYEYDNSIPLYQFTKETLPKEYYLPKIIGHLPKGNAPKLDLPLLPQMVVEDDVQNFIVPLLKKKGDENNTIDLDAYALGLIDSYKAATKKYSEDDLREAFRLGHFIEREDCRENFEKFVQSLNQPKPLKYFVAEAGQIIGCKDPMVCLRGCNTVDGSCRQPIIDKYQLKTTTIGGKEYLVGKYTND
jgi:hypothetical protein